MHKTNTIIKKKTTTKQMKWNKEICVFFSNYYNYNKCSCTTMQATSN